MNTLELTGLAGGAIVFFLTGSWGLIYIRGGPLGRVALPMLLIGLASASTWLVAGLRGFHEYLLGGQDRIT